MAVTWFSSWISLFKMQRVSVWIKGFKNKPPHPRCCWCLIRATFLQNKLAEKFGKHCVLEVMTASCCVEVFSFLGDSSRHLKQSRFSVNVSFSLKLAAKFQGCDHDCMLAGPDGRVVRECEGVILSCTYVECLHQSAWRQKRRLILCL